MKTVLVTGSSGFIGKNLCTQLALLDDIEVTTYNRHTPIDKLSQLVTAADFIFHLAGVNRPQDDSEFMQDNLGLTKSIIDILRDNNLKTPLLITSSIQAELDNPYGMSKLAAEKYASDWHKESSSPVFIYRLPGVFGKWCRPNYNSVVATFCYNIANSLPIQISNPSHVVTLAYIDDVVADFIEHLGSEQSSDPGQPKQPSHIFSLTLGELSDRLYAIRDIRESLIVPNLEDELNKFLYATYISYFDEDDFGYTLAKNSDSRGWLAEFVKSHQFGQIFISETKPGVSRGDHWHQTKIEKFLVIRGEAEITFRHKINSQKILRYKVSGNDLRVIDIPVGYVHAITNVGNEELLTIFWANELLNKSAPDTYYEKVDPKKG